MRSRRSAKIGIEVQQSAGVYTVSRSRKAHAIQDSASKSVQFKQAAGRVARFTITLRAGLQPLRPIYARILIRHHPARHRRVRCRWISKPSGRWIIPISTSKELKIPSPDYHNLLSTQKTETPSRGQVEFDSPGNGSGSPQLCGRTAILTLASQVHSTSTIHSLTRRASRTVSKDSRVVFGSSPMQNAFRRASADKGTLFLRPDNT